MEASGHRTNFMEGWKDGVAGIDPQWTTEDYSAGYRLGSDALKTARNTAAFTYPDPHVPRPDDED